jgi:hypothetical protein
MAIPDDVLFALVAGLRTDLGAAGMVRERGGMARGVAWAEAAGRGPDGAWLELRVHHRPTERRLDAGLLAYQPLSRGGRTVVIGERSSTYRYDPAEVADGLGEEVARWLEAVLSGTSPVQALSMR